MQTVVVLLGFVGAVMCYPWGVPQQVHDTPEVAAAKAAHLAALAKARYSSQSLGAQDRSWNGPEDDGSWTETKYDGHNAGSWEGDSGRPWGGNNGAASRNGEGGSWQGNNGADDGSYKDDGSWKQYDDGSYKGESHSWNSGSGAAPWDNQHERKWTGPVALPPGYDKNGAPLQVLDTPEVAAAKAAHLAALGLHY